MKIKWKKELRDILIIASIFGFLYGMGWHTEVLGRFQQIILYTGVLNPREIPMDAPVPVDPDLVLEDQNGKIVKVVDQWGGKLLVINFWASWCPPCVAEMPSIQRMAEHFKNDTNVVILLINLDEDRHKALEFIRRKDIHLPVYFIRSPLPPAMQFEKIPSTFILDPSFRLVFRREGAMKFHSRGFIRMIEGLKP